MRCLFVICSVALAGFLLLMQAPLGSTVTGTALISTNLPTPMYGMAGFSSGDRIFLLGGYAPNAGGWASSILSFNTTSQNFTQVANLPVGLESPAIAWNGTYAFLFGGKYTTGNFAAFSAYIYRYSPTTNSVVKMKATLSPGRVWSAIAFIPPRHVYLFGGRNNTDGTPLNQILLYDIYNDTLTVLSYHLPVGMLNADAGVFGNSIYLIGGQDWNGTYINPRNEILRYNITSGQITQMTTTLPRPLDSMPSVQVGSSILIFGGRTSSISWTWGSQSASETIVYTDEILEYFPTNDSIAISNATLPSPRSSSSTVYDGKYVYIFGGATGPCCGSTDQIAITNQIYRYAVNPEGVIISPGNGFLGNGLSPVEALASLVSLTIVATIIQYKRKAGSKRSKTGPSPASPLH